MHLRNGLSDTIRPQVGMTPAGGGYDRTWYDWMWVMTGGGSDYTASELSHQLSEMDGRKPSATGASFRNPIRLVWSWRSGYREVHDSVSISPNWIAYCEAVLYE